MTEKVKEYFALQYKLLNRRLKDLGVKPLLAYSIFLFGFAGFSLYLFQRTEFAAYIYILLALAAITRLSERKRNEFLILCFGDKNIRKIRVAENLIVISPFLLFLCYKQLFLFIIILAILSTLFTFGNIRTVVPFAIPTPFYKKPFEFTVGFRNTFLLFFAAYALVIIAIAVNNFNLGIFSLLLVFAVTLSYYIQPEDEYYVWIHKFSPRLFLWDKIKTAVSFSFIVCITIVLLLAVFYTDQMGTIILFYLIGCAFLITVILGKYSAYPDAIDIPELVLLAVSICFPFLLIAIAPYFYYKSIKRLNHLLV